MKRDLAYNPFPPPSAASPDGIVAVGASPEPELLKIAYPQGIFPWPHDGVPLLWFCPDPRFVVVPQRAHVPRSLRKAMRRDVYRVTADTAFSDVMRACSASKRPGQNGTWITDDMVAGYTALHQEGLAHSIEAWRGDELVGGLYGVSFGRVFFGESMFAKAPDASKVAFATLLGHLVAWDFALVDCQTYTDHLARFGAEEWPRDAFLDHLKEAVIHETRLGPWQLEHPPSVALRLLRDDDNGSVP
ncbi:MAG: leucyl/phenylalanyl-tRNA--protein transferase [Myxococcota bacterium]